MGQPRFRTGGRNPWNIYFDRPGEESDVFVGVVFDEGFAKHVVHALNAYDEQFGSTMARNARNQMLARMPEAQR